MPSEVLVLDAGFRPLGKVPWTRAISLFVEGRVEIVEVYAGRLIRSAKQAWPFPAVVRWLHHSRRPFEVGEVRYSREAVFHRDGGCCAYCGVALNQKTFSLDHVIPRSRGGTQIWTNVVTSCTNCNARKGCRTPDEAEMPLRITPKRPARASRTTDPDESGGSGVPIEWRFWLAGSLRYS